MSDTKAHVTEMLRAIRALRINADRFAEAARNFAQSTDNTIVANMTESALNSLKSVHETYFEVEKRLEQWLKNVG